MVRERNFREHEILMNTGLKKTKTQTIQQRRAHMRTRVRVCKNIKVMISRTIKANKPQDLESALDVDPQI